MECERERRNVENAKMQMHEELLSNMARRKAREIFEMERQRKIEEMKRLTETVSEEGIAMAETNDRLSQVHVDLKNAFKRMRVSIKEDVSKKKNGFTRMRRFFSFLFLDNKANLQQFPAILKMTCGIESWEIRIIVKEVRNYAIRFQSIWQILAILWCVGRLITRHQNETSPRTIQKKLITLIQKKETSLPLVLIWIVGIRLLIISSNLNVQSSSNLNFLFPPFFPNPLFSSFKIF